MVTDCSASAYQTLSLRVNAPTPPTVTIALPMGTVTGNYQMWGSATDYATPINGVQIYDLSNSSNPINASVVVGPQRGVARTCTTCWWVATFDSTALQPGVNQTFQVTATDQDSPPLPGSASVKVVVEQPPVPSVSPSTWTGSSRIFAFQALKSSAASERPESDIYLTDPANPPPGAPTPGGLAQITIAYRPPTGAVLQKQFNVPTFGMSCYYTALEWDWGAPPNSCQNVRIGSVQSAESHGTYCSSFIAEVKLQGSAVLNSGTKIQYTPGTRAINSVAQISTADGSAAVVGQTVARDRSIISGTGVHVDLDGIGSNLLANDTGGRIGGYRLDLYQGAGQARCNEEKHMKEYGRLVRIVLFSTPLLAVGADRIAFIKEDHIFIADSDGNNVRQIDSDSRGKGMLRWDAARNRLAYFVHPVGGEKARLVVIGIGGNTIAEAVIRPPSNPPTEGMRGVEQLEWLANGKAWIGGSINPSNCEMFDFDIQTAEESNWVFGKCGSFGRSPDGKHIAKLGAGNHFVPEDQRFDAVVLDQEDLPADLKAPGRYLYTGGAYKVFVLAGPVWSPDSRNIVVLEKRAATGEAAAVILTLDGSATRIPVAPSFLDHPSIRWLGGKIIVGNANDSIQIEPTTRKVTGLAPEMSDQLSRVAQSEQNTRANRSHAETVVRRLGGSDPILLEKDHPGGEKQ